MQLIAFHYQFSRLSDLLIRLGRHSHLIFQPVSIFGIPQRFEMARIVRMIVISSHCAQFIEAFHKHPLAVEVGETQRAMHCFHSLSARPVLNRFQQRRGNGRIIDEIEPTKTQIKFAPLFIEFTGQDSRYTANDLALAISQPVFCLAILKGRVLIPAQGVAFVHVQSRHITGVTPIQALRKENELA